MADHLPPRGFWSYTTSDDRSSGRHLSQLRIRSADALQLLVGRQPVLIFQDVNAIPKGTEWEDQIHTALDKSSFMIPVVTPGFVASEWCCKEVLRFRERENALGRSDLIFPFVYIRADDIDLNHNDECFDRSVLELLNKRQRVDFHDLRFHDVDSYEVRVRIGQLAESVNAALRRPSARPVAQPKPEVTPPPTGPRPAPTILTAAGTVIRDHRDSPELVLIPEGTFTMGVSPNEEEREGVPREHGGRSTPRQSVTIPNPFWLGRYPVTRNQFATFIAETGHEIANEAWTFEADDKGQWDYRLCQNRDWRNPGFQQTENEPVVCVSHEDAMRYIDWLTALTGKPYRLPSEAEWEYAARAGTSTARFWGDGRSEAVQYAKVADRTLMAKMKQDFDPERFFDGDSGYPFTAPVGSFRPNPFGLYDMLGNIWEWTADCWNNNLKGIPSNGSARISGDCSRRVVRGGSWGDYPRYVRAGYRGRDLAGNRSNGPGFRVARTLSAHPGDRV